jgi:hypothetical protein
MKTYGEWRYSSTFLDLGTRWRRVVSFTPLQLLPTGKELRVPIGYEAGWALALPGIKCDQHKRRKGKVIPVLNELSTLP